MARRRSPRRRCSPAAAAATTTSRRRATTATQTVTVRESTPDRDGRRAAGPGRLARRLPSRASSRPSSTSRRQSFGGGKGEASGVILDRDGLILTNNHVVEGTTRDHGRPSTTACTRSRWQGTVIGTAPERDLAVVRVKANDLVPVALAPLVGAPARRRVIAIGFPLGPRRPDRHLRDRLRARSHDRGPERRPDGPAADRRGDQPGQLRRAARRPLGPARRDQHRRHPQRRTENIGFAIAIDEALPVIAQISDAAARRRTGWLGIAYQLGRLGVGRRPARPRLVDPRRRGDGRLSRRACREGGHGRRRRDHRRRRRPDPELDRD